MALALMRAEVWGTGNHLHRVAIRYADLNLEGLTAVAHGRLVITGATGHRLHEQLIFAGLKLSADRPERLGVEATDAALALANDTAITGPLRDQMAHALQQNASQLRAALQARAGNRARQLIATLANRAEQERQHVAATLTELEVTIRREAFGEQGDQLQLITGLQLDAGDKRQVERDVKALQVRPDAIPERTRILLRDQRPGSKLRSIKSCRRCSSSVRPLVKPHVELQLADHRGHAGHR
jgi:hypothetical protein